MQEEDSTRPGPEGGRIEPLRGENARPLFNERIVGELVFGSIVGEFVLGTICPTGGCHE